MKKENVEKQKTIAKDITLSGKGLHTGLFVNMVLKPAEANHGIRFMRIDLEENPVVHAIVDNVIDTSRGTTLDENGVRVATIEHLLAALTGHGIDNVLIELDGPEIPIFDGSSKVIYDAIAEAGIKELDADKKYFELKERVEFVDVDKGIEIVAFPDDHLSLTVQIDYNSKVLGNQYASLNAISDFGKEIAPCRTFVFLHELEQLVKHNLIKGGDVDNAIVIVDRQVSQEELDRLSALFNKPKVQVQPEGVLNNIELRFRNEPARHKLLDLIGDLTLVGMPIKARIIASRPGHHANTEFAKLLRKIIKKESLKPAVPEYNPNAQPVLDINQIMKVLPHRPPFLLVDKIIYRDENTIAGVKNVTMNEPFFVGHFPGEPVMPGVLIVEAMAQCGGLLALNTVTDPENYLTYFLKIDKVKFKKKVVPGDTLIFKLQLIEPIRRGIVTMWGQAFVGETLVTEAELCAQIVKVK
ncbi:MAG: bifunctional UDP-3-O-[3-hydroxymyristoyl] N-acetylglucosamine deacetylase/3-hydroxyacyl-ACP dehydratase [Bacteroidales bacterium]|nr:bifunctional UDP-3-O-[3-hydroxymyristoyl] N-acetylglucosamine deacetylase/3-hydroxyacyl-ACP dehydratase [Bacteroidales bacterium]